MRFFFSHIAKRRLDINLSKCIFESWIAMKISQLCQQVFLFIYVFILKFLQRSSVTNINPAFMVSIYQLFNRLMITALDYQETDRPLYVVCVCVSEGVKTHSSCCPSSYLPPVAAHRNLPVAACSSLVHTHTDRHTASVPACTSRQWVAVVAASSRRGQLCLTSGLDSIQTIRESLTGSLDEIIEWGVRVQASAVRFSVFIYLFSFVRCFIAFCYSARSHQSSW